MKTILSHRSSSEEIKEAGLADGPQRQAPAKEAR